MVKKKALPLQNIALSLSGGGYRAAAFHLGGLSYLHYVQWKGKPLVEQLAVLSTISGGTITGAKYAVCLAQKKAFEVFFGELYDFLKADELLPAALAHLNDEQAWKGSPKQRNLINAFAQVYDERLLDKATFALLFDGPKGGTTPEVVFNSTDLENQLPFRFQRSVAGLFGHGKAEIPVAAAREIRLADVVAASSCFPGGFEPLLMPQDFIAEVNSPLGKFWKDKKALRLMDGGVVDNQGIESVLLFEGRKQSATRKPFVGTFLLSDVARKNVSMMEQEEQSVPFFLRFSILQINRLAALVSVLCMVAIWLSKWKIMTVLGGILLTLSAIWLIIGHWAARKFVGAVTHIVSQESPAFLEEFNILRTIPLHHVIRQISIRVSSLSRLGDVFLKRIRDLNYRMLHSDKNWKYRICTNYIYDLKERKTIKSKALRAIIEQANEMGTTLWFSDAQKLPNASMLEALVVTGQATMCQNLLDYVEEIRKDGYDELSEEMQEELNVFQDACAADFKRFEAKPRWLLDLSLRLIPLKP